MASSPPTALDALLSPEPAAVVLRVAMATVLWCSVRWLLSNLFFDGVVVEGTKSTAALHASIQACAITYILATDSEIGPRMWRMWLFDLGDVDYVHVRSRAVECLVTLAAGEFTMQIIYTRAWFEKPADFVTLLHHVFSALLWPLNVVSGRGVFFMAVYLTYEWSTPFLMLLFFDSVKRRTALHMAVGTLFVLSFVIVRLLTVPATANAIAGSHELARHPSALTPSWHSGRLFPIFFNIERITVALPLLVNIYWGRLVVKGYLKAAAKALRPRSVEAAKIA